MSTASTTTNLVFVQGKPFFEMVMSFLAATVGMGPVFDPANPLLLSPDKLAWYQGKLKPDTVIDMNQIHQQCVSGALTPNAAVKALCCMLINSCYEIAKPHNDKSPEFEFFRHLRNAASHCNHFNFFAREPSRPAAWSGFSIDHTKKGATNPLANTECVGLLVSPGDILALLHEIESKLPN
jgi:hypothetical protein